MPSVNFYIKETFTLNQVETLFPDVKSFIARRLSCGDRELRPEEVSIRLLKIESGMMISPIEIEILAFAYSERVQQQDVICRDIVSFLKEIDSTLPEAHVWLSLTELGHSWEE